MNDDHISRILIKEGVKAALTEILNDQKLWKGTMHKSARLLLARFNALEKQHFAGTISFENYQLELNNIQLALLNLLSRADIKTIKGLFLRRIAGFLTIIVIISGAVWFLNRPKYQVEATLKNLHVSRISMQSRNAVTLFLNQKVKDLSFFNFQSVAIEADSVYPAPESTRELLITSLPDISGASLHLGTVRLENLHFEDSAQIVISQIEGASDRYRIQVQQARPISGRLNYTGVASISSAFVGVQKNGITQEYFEPFEWKLFAPPDKAREIIFTGDPANFIFEFTLMDSILERELLVRHLSFFQPEQQQIKSSILGGELALQEADRTPLKTIRLQPGDRIDLEISNNLSVRRLSLQPAGLFLDAKGKLRTLYTYDSGERRMNNPSWWTWLWHNKKLWMASGFALLLGLMVLLIYRISRQRETYI